MYFAVQSVLKLVKLLKLLWFSFKNGGCVSRSKKIKDLFIYIRQGSESNSLQSYVSSSWLIIMLDLEKNSRLEMIFMQIFKFVHYNLSQDYLFYTFLNILMFIINKWSMCLFPWKQFQRNIIYFVFICIVIVISICQHVSEMRIIVLAYVIYNPI